MQANDFDLYLLSWSMGRDNGAHIWSHTEMFYLATAVNRSSRLEVFCKKGVLRKFTGKHLCQRLFFNKIADLRPEAWDLFLQNTSGGCFCSDGFN